MTVIPSMFVAAPALTPIRYGLLDAALVIEETDPHFQQGTEYEPDYCGPSFQTPAMCQPVALGTASLAVTNVRGATVTLAGTPAGTYTVNWGDGSSGTFTAPGSLAHTYAADGRYTIVVTGPGGYYSTITQQVTNGTVVGATGMPVSGSGKTTVDGVPIVTGHPFNVYNLQSCRAVGQIGESRARAERSLTLGEGRAVEAAMQTLIAPAAVDITPAGTAVDIGDGLAILEQYAGHNYGGAATFHMTRAMATILAGRYLIDKDSGRLETVLGSLVAAGGGYTGAAGPSAPAAGAGWMFATGTVVLRRGRVFSTDPTLGRSGSGYLNDFSTLAERPYVGSWECFAVGVEVKGGTCCSSTAPLPQTGQPEEEPA